jgi:hypothetical protein
MTPDHKIDPAGVTLVMLLVDSSIRGCFPMAGVAVFCGYNSSLDMMGVPTHLSSYIWVTFQAVVSNNLLGGTQKEENCQSEVQASGEAFHCFSVIFGVKLFRFFLKGTE